MGVRLSSMCGTDTKAERPGRTDPGPCGFVGVTGIPGHGQATEQHVDQHEVCVVLHPSTPDSRIAPGSVPTQVRGHH
jgi:hypothetical protein